VAISSRPPGAASDSVRDSAAAAGDETGQHPVAATVGGERQTRGLDEHVRAISSSARRRVPTRLGLDATGHDREPEDEREPGERRAPPCVWRARQEADGRAASRQRAARVSEPVNRSARPPRDPSLRSG
jgi:hypothetical protein